MGRRAEVGGRCCGGPAMPARVAKLVRAHRRAVGSGGGCTVRGAELRNLVLNEKEKARE